jgi:hypothetical protein
MDPETQTAPAGDQATPGDTAPPPKTTARPICVVCGTNSARFSCSKCRVPQYCGGECQGKHWKSDHRQMCAALPKEMGDLVFRSVPLGGETSLAKNAIRTLEDRGERFYRCAVGPKATVRTYLEGLATGMVVRTDPTEFVQLILLALSTKVEDIFAIGAGDTAPWVSIKKLGCVSSKYAPAMFGPTDSDAQTALKLSMGSPGMWVAGPDKRGNYLGLGAGGPCRQPLSVWHREMMGTLEGAAVPGLDLVQGLGDLDFDQFDLRRSVH